MHRPDLPSRKLSRSSFFGRGEPLVFAAMVAVGAVSAVVIKEYTARSTSPALAAVDDRSTMTPAPAGVPSAETLTIIDPLTTEEAAPAVAPAPTAPVGAAAVAADAPKSPRTDLSVRWFNGRLIRPAKTMTMLVTAYSPDEKSCAGSADGITASLHHVNTNAHRLVAADSRVLPLGSMITIPGYDNGQVVPVLDRGGKIKGNHLDVLFPTDAEARAWGVRRIKVTVWEYADGRGPENWRAIRDSKN
ncbi:MAG: 3D domain-containing protein [Phycisphaerales bacterium]|nr:3D domain-containing protein [Phycisphaerales bacterium]